MESMRKQSGPAERQRKGNTANLQPEELQRVLATTTHVSKAAVL